MDAWIILALDALFFGSAAAICFKQGRLVSLGLRHAAGQFGGRLVPGGWAGSERLETEVDGVPGRLLYVPWRHRCLRASFAWKSEGRLSVGPKGWGDRFEEVFAGIEIPLGDTEFERRFLVRGAPAAWVREALDPKVRACIAQLADLCRYPLNGNTLRIESGPAGVSVICNRLAALEPAKLVRFFELAVAVLRRLRSVQTGVVGVLTAEEVAKHGVCPVCSESLGGRMMRCNRCQTLHHEDCWKYFGGCSIFGCDAGRGRPEGQKGMPGIP